jgi:arsenate reductase (glutaredoxin)
MSDITIYHNPRCSKSRATLALIHEHGLQAQIVEYLKTPPNAAELEFILKKLDIRAEALIRRGEDVFKSRYAGKTLTENEWILAMIQNPLLIERPIVVRGDRAVIGRPPENVAQLF